MKENKPSFCSRIHHQLHSIVSNITIEPVFFMIALCYGSFIIASKELYISKVCNVNFNYSKHICDHIEEHKDIQVKVQEHVASLSVYNSIIQAIPGCIYALLAGPWSDRNGRKVLMLCSVCGYILSNGVFLINTYFFYELKAEWLLFECIQDLTGGSSVFFLAAYSYIADVSEVKSRTRRFAYLDGLFPLGFYTANALAGPIKANLGLMYNFALGMLCAIICFAYCLLFVKESKVTRDKILEKEKAEMIESSVEKEGEREIVMEAAMETNLDSDDGKNLCYSFFNIRNLVEGFTAVVRKRRYHKRTFIILLIIAFEMEIFSLHGKWNCMFLYVKVALDWTIVEFGYYTSILGFLGLIAQYALVPILTGIVKLHDSTIALIDSLTSVVNYLIIAFASSAWMLYVGGAVAILDATSTTMYRSLITKMVNPDEVGKVFSIVGTFQALLPFMSGPAYNYLYRYTVSYMPSAWIFLVIAIRLFNFSVLLIVNIGIRRCTHTTETRKENHERPKYNTEKEKKMENFVLDSI